MGRNTYRAIVVALSACGGDAMALDISIDQNASYRYINATSATNQGAPPSNWFTPGFDDSTWSVGNAPFADRTPSSSILNAANVNAPFAPGVAPAVPSTRTQWDVNFDPFLRTHFNLAAPTALTIWIAVDNGVIDLYLNGVEATQGFNLEGNAFRWEHVFDVPANFTFAGDNLIALQLEDHGGATGFTMVVTSDDSATNPIFTTNPPPPPRQTNGQIPEPATMAMFGAGLLGLAAARRRRRSR